MVLEPSGVYRTVSGLIFRIANTVEGGLKVEVLKDGVWSEGRIQLVGLRLKSSTTKLSSNAIEKLPL